MGRKQIKDIRHEELIDATITAVHRHGYSAVTISQIAAEGNTATGSIHYYFGSKVGLLEATMRHLLKILKQAVLDRLETANTPREKVIAIATANFDDRLFSIAQCSVWIQFWSSAPYEIALSRLHRINRSRVRSNLRAALNKILSPEASETARRALQAYMDGVWLQAAQSNVELNPAEARLETTRVVEMLLGTDSG
ncbi:MAG: TetR/AcrR family bet gene transcriptional repressor [Gammaproteobacteria bacterium]|jgi:TetR/AcrR family transcriptional repressor of bet genes